MKGIVVLLRDHHDEMKLIASYQAAQNTAQRPPHTLRPLLSRRALSSRSRLPGTGRLMTNKIKYQTCIILNVLGVHRTLEGMEEGGRGICARSRCGRRDAARSAAANTADSRARVWKATQKSVVVWPSGQLPHVRKRSLKWRSAVLRFHFTQTVGRVLVL